MGIRATTFKGFPIITGASIDVGTLAVDSLKSVQLHLFVNYLLDYPKKVPVPNVTITLTDTLIGIKQTVTSPNGEATFDLASRTYRVNITQPAIWERETYYDLTGDRRIEEYVTDTIRCSTSLKFFFEYLYLPPQGKRPFRTWRLKKKFKEVQVHADSSNTQAWALLDIYKAEFDTLNELTKLTPRNPEGLFTGQVINLTPTPQPPDTRGYYSVEIPNPWPFGVGLLQQGLTVDVKNGSNIIRRHNWNPGNLKLEIQTWRKHEINKSVCKHYGYRPIRMI